MRVWIDIDNSPHVPFFLPVLRALKERGDEVCVTTRRYAQTLELLRQANVEFHIVGEHAGANSVKKIGNLLRRTWQLSRVIASFAPQVALSHGSRALSLCAKLRGIPNVLLFDYEWTEMHIFKRCANILACPAVLPETILDQAGLPLHKIRRYNGFKEEMYLGSFIPDATFRQSIEIPDDKILVTIRPSSMTSNYHDQRSEKILRTLLLRVATEQNVIGLVTPRTETDKAFVQSIIKEHSISNVRISERTLPGMQLLYWSDVVVSGGGTMNRESALLGTNTISMFTGRRPSIDEYLASQNKLRFVSEPEDVANIEIRRHIKDENFRFKTSGIVDRVVELMLEGAALKA